MATTDYQKPPSGECVFGLIAVVVTVLLACGGGGTSGGPKPNDPNSYEEPPEECKTTVTDVIAAGLSGGVAAQNGTQNEALVAQRARCDRAMDARNFNRMASIESQRLELERQRLELERERQRMDEESRREQARAEARDAERRAEERRQRRPATVGDSRVPVYVFDGGKRDVFLGCLMCLPGNDADSIFNPRGDYGHCPRYGAKSLFCHEPAARFGGTSFSDESACNTTAQSPPVIVNDDGFYFGRLSVSTAFGHNDSVCNPVGHYADRGLCAIAKVTCTSPFLPVR
jgi:hypothetical protein